MDASFRQDTASAGGGVGIGSQYNTQSLSQVVGSKGALAHQGLVDSNPSALRTKDSPNKVQPLSELIGEKPGKARGVHPGSILLDKDERELLRQGENVT